MKIELKTALISAIVALVTSGVGFYATILQEDAWITEIQTNKQGILYEKRLDVYPSLLNTLGALSSLRKDSLSNDGYLKIACDMNDWFYSKEGGLVMSIESLSAFEELKLACRNPSITDKDLKLIYDYKNVLVYFLRWDLHLKAYNPYGGSRDHSLKKLINETKKLKKSKFFR